MFDPSCWCLNGGFLKWKIPKSPWLSVPKWCKKWMTTGGYPQFRTPPNDHPWWFEGHFFFGCSAAQVMGGVVSLNSYIWVQQTPFDGSAQSGPTQAWRRDESRWKHQAIVASSNLLGYSNYVYLKLSKVISIVVSVVISIVISKAITL